ncbi:hypothetical protein [Bacillus sp. YC2]|uniref:hypothetical protein n=1 Tax=Bacillus sp. YC2 TaxID=2861287 RepID=UPI00223BFA8F|nr:hypothetical protein [Bacillus sp. YC2]
MIVAVILIIKEEIKGAVIVIEHIAVKDAAAKTLAVMKDGVRAVIQIIIMQGEQQERQEPGERLE